MNPPTVTTPTTLPDAVRCWLEQAREKLAAGALTGQALNDLEQVIDRPATWRQRLLYVTTHTPNPGSGITTFYAVDPVPGGANITLTPEPAFPYQSVHEAMCDGWQILQAPDDRAPVQDREIDHPGYTFILHKLEAYCDSD